MIYDVAIIGGGHNGLVAANYLAIAGLKVVVLEKLDVLGGAAISTKAFEGVDANLSRYSYLVSLLPKRIIEELKLDVTLATRRYGSFTPDNNSNEALLIDKEDDLITAKSFISIEAENDFAAWKAFYAKTEDIARKIFPTVLEPLKTASEIRALVGEDNWKLFFEQPIGRTIEKNFESDLVRGVVMTDALIGTFADNEDETLQTNKCFLYHVIGNETGEWSIPIGGMGNISKQLAARAAENGAELLVNCEVKSVTENREITFTQAGINSQIQARFVLANVAQPTLEKLLGKTNSHNVQGAQVKVNMLVKRLPKLKSHYSSNQAFGGTFHINERYTQLNQAFQQASSELIPDPLPLEIYCHSLTDPSILSTELQESGIQTITAFSLQTPHSLLKDKDQALMRAKLQKAVIDSINSVLVEDISDLLVLDGRGQPCIETKTTQDLEEELGLPGGNIFHGPLSWPFADNDEDLSTPAKRWGVETGYPNIFFCGSSSKRGGAVSGIGGHNASMAVLEEIKLKVS